MPSELFHGAKINGGGCVVVAEEKTAQKRVNGQYSQ